MMWKCSRTAAFILAAGILISGCREKRDDRYALFAPGCWWRLVAFAGSAQDHSDSGTVWVNAVFKTQDDSVFYDSSHDMRDRFFISRGRNLGYASSLKKLMAGCAPGDSANALLSTRNFFSEHFASGVPYFCRGDSVVKVEFSIKKIFSNAEFKAVEGSFRQDEQKQILAFFGSQEKMMAAKDPSGVYWVENRPAPADSAEIKPGDALEIEYQGAFLNGRVVDISPAHFQLVYGTPDQLIKGLNIVIRRLKRGLNSKIILPSHLAFGEGGSSNGSIPPYTPMLYKISIKEINN